MAIDKMRRKDLARWIHISKENRDFFGDELVHWLRMNVHRRGLDEKAYHEKFIDKQLEQLNKKLPPDLIAIPIGGD